MKRNVLVAAIITSIAIVASSAHSAPLPVTITFNKNDKAATACARALDETKSILSDLIDIDVRLQPQDTEREHRLGLKKIEGFNLQILTYDWASTRLLQLPFLFRDAAHFQEFLKSDLYREYIDFSQHGEIAVAYGGFFQMFSYEAAVTEPKHFYNRFIAGIAQAPGVYAEFGGRIGLSMGFMGANTVAEDARQMAEGHKLRNMVEGLLISAIENGLDKNAKFVNLISSTVNAIYFESGSGYSDLPRATKRRIRAWGDAASIRCSAENFELEVETLARLKAAGLTIVPFNRNAMIEASFKTALGDKHVYWTTSDLDRLAQIGDKDKSVPAPSNLLAKLSPQKRSEALNHEKEAAELRKDRLKWLGEVQAQSSLSDQMEDQAIAYSVKVAALGPPKRLMRTKLMEPDKSADATNLLRRGATQLLEAIRACSDCKKNPGAWASAAHALFLSGDLDSARDALNQAFELSKAITNAKVIQVAAWMGDPRAKNAALKYADSISEIPRFAEPRDLAALQIFRLRELCTAAILLVQVGESARAKAAVDEAAEIAKRIDKKNVYEPFAFFVAAARYQAIDEKEGWDSLIGAIRNEGEPKNWPISKIGQISVPVIDKHLLESRIEHIEKFAEVIRKAKPKTNSSKSNWYYSLDRAARMSADYGFTDRANAGLKLLISGGTQVSADNRKYYLEVVEELKRYIAEAERKNTLPAAQSPESRIRSLHESLERLVLRFAWQQ